VAVANKAYAICYEGAFPHHSTRYRALTNETKQVYGSRIADAPIYGEMPLACI